MPHNRQMFVTPSPVLLWIALIVGIGALAVPTHSRAATVSAIQPVGGWFGAENQGG